MADLQKISAKITTPHTNFEKSTTKATTKAQLNTNINTNPVLPPSLPDFRMGYYPIIHPRTVKVESKLQKATAMKSFTTSSLSPRKASTNEKYKLLKAERDFRFQVKQAEKARKAARDSKSLLQQGYFSSSLVDEDVGGLEPEDCENNNDGELPGEELDFEECDE